MFEEKPDALLQAGPFESRAGAPRVSSPERAFLEMPSEVGTRQSMEEARQLAEGMHTARTKAMRELLQRCKSVKTMRLASRLGSELESPWRAKLDPSTKERWQRPSRRDDT